MALIPLTFSVTRAALLTLLQSKSSLRDADKDIFRFLAAKLDGAAGDTVQLKLEEIRALFVNLTPP